MRENAIGRRGSRVIWRLGQTTPKREKIVSDTFKHSIFYINYFLDVLL